MKKLNALLKKLGQNNRVTFFISILCLASISIIVGIGDYDVIWQTHLGKVILTEHRFDGLKDLVWGTQGYGWYLDHEWLTNVIFYLLNCLFGQMGGIIAFKCLVVVLFSISVFYLVKEFTDFNDMSWFTYLACTCLTYSYTIILIKPKAYDLSAILMMCLLILLERYNKQKISFKTFAVFICFITILWNNLHSGSVLLIFGLVGAYWLFYWRDLKTVLLGLVDILMLCVNPFGYNLIYFDITHFSDSVMKKVVTEWASFNLESSAGKAAFLFIAIMFLHLLHMKRDKENWIYFFFFFVFTLMTVISKRHYLYLYPIGMILFIKGQFKDLEKWKIKTFILPTLLIILLAGFVHLLVWLTIPTVPKTYMKSFITEDLKNVLVDTVSNDNEGFYDGDQNVWDLGLKSFRIGAFPFVRERNIASYYLERGNDKQIKAVIDKYKLNKFLFYRHDLSVEGELINSNLYDYLIDKPQYKILYDDGRLVYFVEK